MTDKKQKVQKILMTKSLGKNLPKFLQNLKKANKPQKSFKPQKSPKNFKTSKKFIPAIHPARFLIRALKKGLAKNKFYS